MSDKIEKKEKKKLFIYMIIIFVVVSLFVFLFIFYNKIFVLEYSVDNISFKYYSNFKVRKEDEKISIISKDGFADIEINLVENNSSYSSSDYSRVSNDVINNIIDSSKYDILVDKCVDHMCTRIYESDKDKVEWVVEFRGNLLVIYEFRSSRENFDKYISGFDIIVNSFVNQEPFE